MTSEDRTSLTTMHPLFDAILRAHSAPQQDIYRGWKISRGGWPEPAWSATSPNYDASYEGPEDGWVDNGEKADATTREALLIEIDAWFDENATT
jgi:hypothetical protein